MKLFYFFIQIIGLTHNISAVYGMKYLAIAWRHINFAFQWRNGISSGAICRSIFLWFQCWFHELRTFVTQLLPDVSKERWSRGVLSREQSPTHFHPSISDFTLWRQVGNVGFTSSFRNFHTDHYMQKTYVCEETVASRQHETVFSWCVVKREISTLPSKHPGFYIVTSVWPRLFHVNIFGASVTFMIIFFLLQIYMCFVCVFGSDLVFQQQFEFGYCSVVIICYEKEFEMIT